MSAVFLNNENATLDLGQKLAEQLQAPARIYLSGRLGAGKTTFARAIIQALGYTGKVKSPTYTIVEPYPIGPLTVYHFDFYRIHDPLELALIGINEYFYATAICLVEWPELAKEMLPTADLWLNFSQAGDGRQVEIAALSQRGEIWLTGLALDR